MCVEGSGGGGVKRDLAKIQKCLKIFQSDLICLKLVLNLVIWEILWQYRQYSPIIKMREKSDGTGFYRSKRYRCLFFFFFLTSLGVNSGGPKRANAAQPVRLNG